MLHESRTMVPNPSLICPAMSLPVARFRAVFCLLGCMMLTGFLNASAIGQGTDTVIKRDGTRVSGRVLSMTANAVTLDVRRSETTIPVAEIDYVRFFDEARRTPSAREYIESRQYEQAAKELAAMNDEWAEARSVAALDGLYLLANAKSQLALAGTEGHSLSDAVAILREYRERGKEHYNYYPASLLYARLGKAANRLDLAKQEFSSLKDVTDPSIALDANLELGMILLLEDSFEPAAQAFQKASGLDVTDSQSIKKKTIAQIYLQVAKAGAGDADQAVEAIQQILKSQSPEDYFVNGYAYNALGNIHLMKNQPKQAEVDFLHTDLLFAANSDAHAEALFHLVQIWNQMGKSDRVAEGRDKLMNRYGGTYWTSRLTSQ